MMTDQNRTIDLDFNMVKTVYGESHAQGTYVEDEDRSSIDSTLFLAIKTIFSKIMTGDLFT